jgi:hypothetical protein
MLSFVNLYAAVANSCKNLKYENQFARRDLQMDKIVPSIITGCVGGAGGGSGAGAGAGVAGISN